MELEDGAGMGTLCEISTDLSKIVSKVLTKKRERDDDSDSDDHAGGNEASFDDIIPSQADPMKYE